MNCSSRRWMLRGSWWRMCSISLMGVALKIAVLADEDVEEDPDRWCSYTACGQELWQIACQWVWNLRLSPLDRRCRASRCARPFGPLPQKLLLSSSLKTLTGSVWPVAVGRRVRTSHGANLCRGLRVARGREAALPSRGQPVVERSASRERLYRSRPSRLSYQTDCQPCSLREQCLAKGGQRGSSPSRECGPPSLASTRTCDC